jgi:hypothetical protein
MPKHFSDRGREKGKGKREKGKGKREKGKSKSSV